MKGELAIMNIRVGADTVRLRDKRGYRTSKVTTKIAHRPSPSMAKSVRNPTINTTSNHKLNACYRGVSLDTKSYHNTKVSVNHNRGEPY